MVVKGLRPLLVEAHPRMISTKTGQSVQSPLGSSDPQDPATHLEACSFDVVVLFGNDSLSSHFSLEVIPHLQIRMGQTS